VGLTRDGSDQLEVRVVVENHETSPLRHRGHEGIDQREGAVLAAGSQLSLQVDGTLMIRLCRRHRWKGGEMVLQRCVVGSVASREPQLERDGGADRDESLDGQRGERGRHGWLGQPRKDACVDEVARSRHLLVASPGVLRSLEVEPALLAEEGDELEPSPSIHDLRESGVDRRPQRLSAQDLGCLARDIRIDFNRCLGHG
jgi:hypothetical protein